VDHEKAFFKKCSVFEEDRQFDVVTAIEVIEHIYEPHSLVRKLSEIVVPGGLLYIESSDTDRALKHMNLGLNNGWFNPPVHCVSYDLKSWSLILSLHGFEILKDFSKDGGHFSLIVVARKR
jgi:2-polyprenyl-3-methyl-5-hydroxy-6-metoxy-1,4-benzoquinol methylase